MSRFETIHTPVLIVGGSTGGVAAALACARNGVRCVVIEETSWIGGQLTTQGVPPDENAWIEGNGPNAPSDFKGCTQSYTEMRERVRAWYREHRPLKAEKIADPFLNPGGGWVSRLCAEPRVIEFVLRSMISTNAVRGRIILKTNHVMLRADSDGDRTGRVLFQNKANGDLLEVVADLVLDATDLGDVIDATQTESCIGAEAADVFGELHGRTDLPKGQRFDERDQQAFSWCFAIEHRACESHIIERPSNYGTWCKHVPEMSPAWTGPLFSWTVPSHDAEYGRTIPMVPWPDEPRSDEWELWRYRRIVDHNAYLESARNKFPDVTLVNWVQMDFWQDILLGKSTQDRVDVYEAARDQSRCLLYWMQTEAPRHDGGTGYPGLRLRGDELGSEDGFALGAYIREPRRLLAQTMLTEAHVGTAQRKHENAPNQSATQWGSGEAFKDSIAIGHYPIDLHPSAANRNNVYVPAAPFRVPLSALVPVRMRNIIAAGKAMGVSHVANGCTRLHPVEWGVGEAAGLLAAWCINNNTEPHAMCSDIEETTDFQQHAVAQGMPVAWPWDE
ncbi:MAG: FAD-dependent oxidoreductase [Phycisphaerales bacterium]